jgi:hypothetical protein
MRHQIGKENERMLTRVRACQKTAAAPQRVHTAT